MTTPTQPKLTIETPYGTGVLRDARHYKDKEGWRAADYGYVTFETVTVNRKEYKNTRFALKKGREGEDKAFYFWSDNGYAALTASAQDKIQDALNALDPDLIAPFIDELDDESKRAQLKHDMAYELKQGIYKVAPSRHERGPEFDEKNALIDEIFEDLLQRRAAGADWNSIYFDDDLKKAGK